MLSGNQVQSTLTHSTASKLGGRSSEWFPPCGCLGKNPLSCIFVIANGKVRSRGENDFMTRRLDHYVDRICFRLTIRQTTTVVIPVECLHPWLLPRLSPRTLRVIPWPKWTQAISSQTCVRRVQPWRSQWRRTEASGTRFRLDYVVRQSRGSKTTPVYLVTVRDRTRLDQSPLDLVHFPQRFQGLGVGMVR